MATWSQRFAVIPRHFPAGSRDLLLPAVRARDPVATPNVPKVPNRVPEKRRCIRGPDHSACATKNNSSFSTKRHLCWLNVLGSKLPLLSDGRDGHQPFKAKITWVCLQNIGGPELLCNFNCMISWFFKIKFCDTAPKQQPSTSSSKNLFLFLGRTTGRFQHSHGII